MSLRSLSRAVLLTFALALAGCGGGDGRIDDAPAPPPSNGSPLLGAGSGFGPPERVVVLGYDDSAMEPFLSPDGRYLFFNNSGENLDLRYAEKITDTLFVFRGNVAGANTSFFDAVPSIDRDGNFYFISLRDFTQTFSTIFRGKFADGAVTGVEHVPDIRTPGTALLDFDATISNDGQTLYYATGLYFYVSVPLAGIVSVATRTPIGFTRAANSDDIMREVNGGGIAYAPAISKSELEIFFNRSEGLVPVIYTATRTSTSEPFTNVRKVTAIPGFGEGPALSPDEKSIYYHTLEGAKFVLYRITRP